MKRLILSKLMILCFLVIGNISIANAQDAEYILSDEYKNAVRLEFYRLVNEHRRANRLRELEVNTALEQYADIRAAEQRIRFGHTRPDGSAAGSGWYNSQNHMNTRFAENAVSVTNLRPNPIETANYWFNMWRRSPGHNRHMLYNFSPQIQMALGIAPELNQYGVVISGGIWATGYDEYHFNIPENTTSIRQNEYANSGFTSVTIPDSVTSIGFGGFYSCRLLLSITIPGSVTSIGGSAFQNCVMLTSVTFEGTISSANFSSNSFPGDLRTKYLSGGPGVYTREEGSNTWTKQDPTMP